MSQEKYLYLVRDESNKPVWTSVLPDDSGKVFAYGSNETGAFGLPTSITVIDGMTVYARNSLKALADFRNQPVSDNFSFQELREFYGIFEIELRGFDVLTFQTILNSRRSNG